MRGVCFDKTLISYYDTVQDLYVFLGKEPLKDSAVVPMSALIPKNVNKIKY